jgi:hypothetical protein
MTTNPAPGVKLDPEVLAAAVPLRRVGTIQVCSCYKCQDIRELTGERIWQVQRFSWPAVQERMSMERSGWWMGGGLGRSRAHIRIITNVHEPGSTVAVYDMPIQLCDRTRDDEFCGFSAV